MQNWTTTPEDPPSEADAAADGRSALDSSGSGTSWSGAVGVGTAPHVQGATGVSPAEGQAARVASDS